jgi:dTDP-4-dehydrorhamnose 3,5-epimerase
MVQRPFIRGRLADAGITYRFVQENRSRSERAGMPRGLHFQLPPHGRAKLFTVLRGRVFGVAVDTRRGSRTYGRFMSMALPADDGRQLYIPVGFAPGLCMLEDGTEIYCKVSAYYAPLHEGGIRWNDPYIALPWPVDRTAIIMSRRDECLPLRREFQSPFPCDGHPRFSPAEEARVRILVTGAAGFIGSALVRHLVLETEHDICVVDKLTYAGTLASLDSIQGHAHYHFSRTDICDRAKITQLFSDFDPDAVVHLAAESRIDRSIDRPAEFVTTNVVGTYALLEAALVHWGKLGAARTRSFRFNHVSTDEVYGSLGEDRYFTEQTRYDPHSPYAATKARPHPTTWCGVGPIPTVYRC